jgi:hypothetical protein
MLLASSILRSLEINDVVYLLKFLTDSYGSSSFITSIRKSRMKKQAMDNVLRKKMMLLWSENLQLRSELTNTLNTNRTLVHSLKWVDSFSFLLCHFCKWRNQIVNTCYTCITNQNIITVGKLNTEVNSYVLFWQTTILNEQNVSFPYNNNNSLLDKAQQITMRNPCSHTMTIQVYKYWCV